MLDVVERQPQFDSGVDPRSQLIFNGYIESRRTIALAQPTEWSRAGIELAARTLANFHGALTALGRASDISIADRIRQALESANADLLDHQLRDGGHDLRARIGIGAAIVQVDANIATIGLVPPAQFLLWQDGCLTWCPTRESWAGAQPGLVGAPLGWSSESQPTIVATAINGRDEVVITTDSLARRLSECPSSRLKSSEAVCDRILEFASDETVDPMPLIAVATRLIVPSMTGTLLGATRHTVAELESRVRSAFTALRSQA